MMSFARYLVVGGFALVVCTVALAVTQINPSSLPSRRAVDPVRSTVSLPRDADDPAIWVNPVRPVEEPGARHDESCGPDGALAVFGLDGRLQHLLKGPNRPNNVDVEYGLNLGGVPTDIAVLTEREGRRLRVYAIAPDGSNLRDVSSGDLHILEGAPGPQGGPMGIGLYRRPGDGAIFAVVSPKAGPKSNYLWQYRLSDDGAGRVKATFVRRFGTFSGNGEIEAIVVDDELGYVYYSDERVGIHKWPVDPDAKDANQELALFGTTGYRREREGLGIYALANGTGYIVSVDQQPGESVFHIFRREGEPGRPHDHSEELMTFRGHADATDGLDVTSACARSGFSQRPDGRDEQFWQELPLLSLAGHRRGSKAGALTAPSPNSR